MKNKLDKLNINEIAKGVDKDLNVEPIKVKTLPESIYAAFLHVDLGGGAIGDQAKMSETAKKLADERKKFNDALKNNAAEQTMDLTEAEKHRQFLSRMLKYIMDKRTECVSRFKQAVNEVKGGNGIGDDVNKKLRINALKDTRHNELMMLLTISKQLISESKAFIKAVKGMKKKKAA